MPFFDLDSKYSFFIQSRKNFEEVANIISLSTLEYGSNFDNHLSKISFSNSDLLTLTKSFHHF